jgi:PAS domain S-box-containing protein
MAINKKIDIMLNIAKSKEREKFFLFTSKYQNNKISIFSHKDSRDITDIKSLYGKKVAVVEGFIQEEILSKNHPLIQRVLTKNVQESLRLLNEKKVAATIDSYLTTNYIISDMTFDQIIYKGDLYLENDTNINLHIGVRNDYKILHSILQKAIANVSTSQMHEIRKKWTLHNTITNKVDLTKKELKWIESHPIIHVGGELDWAPFDFVDESGEYTGLSKDYLDYINILTGLNFKIHTGQSWEELLNSLKTGDLDMLPAIYFSKERENYINFTSAYLAIADYYITKENHPKIDSIKYLYGKKVVAIKGYAVTRWLKENHPQIQLLEVDNILKALRAIESNEAIALLHDNPSATYTLEKNFISGIKINNIVKNRTPIPLHMGVKKGFEPLVSIINKTLKSISREQKKDISNKWMSSLGNNENLDLSENEISWLSTKPTIKFSVDPNWLPIEGIDKKTKRYEGIMADYLEKIKELTGLNFELIPTKDWSDSVNLLKEQKVDMLAAVSITPQREKFLNFSETTIRLTDGIIMRSDSSFISDIEDLNGLKVGVSNGTSVHNMLKVKYPNLILIPIKGTENGINNLLDGTIDAFVGNLEVISNIIFKKNLLNLKVVLKLEKTRQLHIALHKDFPIEAVNIINKAIKAIGKDELNIIRKRWIGLKVNDKVDYSLFWKTGIGVLILFLLIGFNNRKLKHMVDEKTEEITNLLSSYDKNVIASKTDTDGNITYVSEAFCKQTGYTQKELIGKTHRILRDPSMPDEIFSELWDTIKSGKTWKGEVKNRMKDGSFNWVEATISPEYDKKGNLIGYNAIRQDITSKKEVEELTENLEIKVQERTQDLEKAKEDIEMILESILIPVLITDKEDRTILYANKYAETQYDTTLDKMIGASIENIYVAKDQGEALSKQMQAHGRIENMEQSFLTNTGKEFTAILSVIPIRYKNKSSYIGMTTDITKQKEMENQIRAILKNTEDSIKYAALIQHALMPSKDLFDKYFNEYFTIWNPKDIVGGDIYLFEELKNDEECILMVIDCTGHGVPGAFVTMLVKAIERQVTSIIKNNKDQEVSPAWVLSYFNKTMKYLLKQENKTSISNAGFDGSVFYYNKKDNIVKFAGAETPLFYVEDKKMKIIKGDRHSVGYKKSDASYQFTDHTIKVKKGMQFYLTTDGYLDQNGGDKGFPFGKKRFKSIIEESYNCSFEEKEKIILKELEIFQHNEERNDDITVIGVQI